MKSQNWVSVAALAIIADLAFSPRSYWHLLGLAAVLLIHFLKQESGGPGGTRHPHREVSCST